MSLARTLQLLLAVAFLSAVTACTKEEGPSAYPSVGDTLPEFHLQEVSSQTLSEGETLLVFFHTDCPDCRKELQLLQPFYDKYHDSVRIVLISREESEETISAYWKEHGYSLPYIARRDRYPYELFSDKGIPYVVYSVDGVILGIWNDRVLFSEEEFLKLHLL